MAVASVLGEQKFSGSHKCDGRNRSSVAVASVLGGTEVQYQWQEYWQKQKFNCSGKCVYGNINSVAVPSVLVGTEVKRQ